jgi:hypothetical protein
VAVIKNRSVETCQVDDENVNVLEELKTVSGKELSALMPSILDKAFKGEL